MGSNVNKIFLQIDGEPIIARTIALFESNKLIDKIVIVAREGDIRQVKSIVLRNGFSKIYKIVAGGKERQDSVLNGLLSLNGAEERDIILIHNAVNPFVEDETIADCISNAKTYGACAVGFKVNDTIKRIGENGYVIETVDRRNLWRIQTPQAFHYHLILKAHKAAKNRNFSSTDDASLVEELGEKVKVVLCSSLNVKITTPEDLPSSEHATKIEGNR